MQDYEFMMSTSSSETEAFLRTTRRSHLCCTEFGCRNQSWKIILWRILNFVMFLLFVVAVVFQWNDPDTHVWVVAYAVPALLAFSVTLWTKIQEYLVWKLVVVMHMLGCFAGMIFISVKYRTKLSKAAPNIVKIEEGWELCGLIFIVVWLGVTSIVVFYDSCRRLCVFPKASQKSKTGAVIFKHSSAFEPDKIEY